MEKEFEPQDSPPATTPATPPEKETEDIFAVKEIEIEEMAIDGICGVY